MSETRSPEPNFDTIARAYKWLEYGTLGPLLERTRGHFLPLLHGRRQALILGDGDGRFTARLLTREQAMHVHAVDTSGVMLELLRRNVARSSPSAAARLTTAQTDARSVVASRHTDLIVTHFFLDCLSQTSVSLLVDSLASSAAPDAAWLVSDFRIPEGWLRHPAGLYIRLLYFAFRLLTGLRITALPDFATPLREARFERIAERHFVFGILTTELWQRSPQNKTGRQAAAQ